MASELPLIATSRSLFAHEFECALISELHRSKEIYIKVMKTAGPFVSYRQFSRFPHALPSVSYVTGRQAGQKGPRFLETGANTPHFF